MLPKARRATMQLTVNKNLNDGLITLHHVLCTIIPRIGDYRDKTIPYAEIPSLKHKSGLNFTELFTQHTLISQKLLQWKDDYGPEILHGIFLKILCNFELCDYRFSM